jgi:hypothetical protein
MSIQDTLNQRQKTHGDFQENGRIMQMLKEVMRMKGKNWDALPAHQKEALEMIQHKIGRILSGNPNEPDHWKDIAGYATLVQNILETGQSHIPQKESESRGKVVRPQAEKDSAYVMPTPGYVYPTDANR